MEHFFFSYTVNLVRFDNQLLQIFQIHFVKAAIVTQISPFLWTGNLRHKKGLGLHLYLIFYFSPLSCIPDFKASPAWINLLHFVKQIHFWKIIVQNQPISAFLLFLSSPHYNYEIKIQLICNFFSDYFSSMYLEKIHLTCTGAITAQGPPSNCSNAVDSDSLNTNPVK